MAETHNNYVLSSMTSVDQGFEEGSAGQFWLGFCFGCSQTVAETATAREGG